MVDVVTARALRLALATNTRNESDDGVEDLLRLARGNATTIAQALTRVRAAVADRPGQVGNRAEVLLASALAQARAVDGMTEQSA